MAACIDVVVRSSSPRVAPLAVGLAIRADEMAARPGPRAARRRVKPSRAGPRKRVTVVSICLVLYGTVHRRVAEPGMQPCIVTTVRNHFF